MVEREGYWPIVPDTELPGMWSHSDFLGGQDEAEEITMSMQRDLLESFAEFLITDDWVITVDDDVSMSDAIDEFMAMRREQARAVDSTPHDTGKWG